MDEGRLARAMASDRRPERALIFRIVHRDNLPWILDHGLHCGHAELFDPSYVAIGNAELIANRRHRAVGCPPNGTLGDYIPFYFTPFPPMMLDIKTGHGDIRRRTNDEIINFPTKKHWRQASKIEWIVEGLQDLRRVIVENAIRSIALPPLGSGNGGLDWLDVRAKIVTALDSLPDVEVLVYEPTSQYQNVGKRAGAEHLTPARALMAELVRRYLILGIECTILEIQKLAYLLERAIVDRAADNPLDLRFSAHRYGPYSDRLNHLLDALDGSYLHCDKRLADAGPFDSIWFDDAKKDKVEAYLASADAKPYRPALEATATTIDGFQSPLGMELLATVDWLLDRGLARPSVGSIQAAMETWPGGEGAGAREQKLFDERLIALALARLAPDRPSPSG